MLKKLLIGMVFIFAVSTISYSQEKFTVSGEAKFPKKAAAQPQQLDIMEQLAQALNLNEAGIQSALSPKYAGKYDLYTLRDHGAEFRTAAARGGYNVGMGGWILFKNEEELNKYLASPIAQQAIGEFSALQLPQVQTYGLSDEQRIYRAMNALSPEARESIIKNGKLNDERFVRALYRIGNNNPKVLAGLANKPVNSQINFVEQYQP
jgi:hypothetical protein